MKKADYREIAGSYDRGRALSETTVNLWLDLAASMSGAGPGTQALDLGCGTGRFTVPMATRLGWQVTGADASAEMLAKAREKDMAHRVIWDVRDAHDPGYADGNFGVIFMSHLLHHCEDPARVIRECHRMLIPGGVLLVRYATIEDIRNDPIHTFFPETVEVYRNRMPSGSDFERQLRDLGFMSVRTEVINQQTSENAADIVARIVAKSTSDLTMIPEVAFQRGLERLQQYAEQHPDDPWLLHDRIRLTAAQKPSRQG